VDWALSVPFGALSASGRQQTSWKTPRREGRSPDGRAKRLDGHRASIMTTRRARREGFIALLGPFGGFARGAVEGVETFRRRLEEGVYDATRPPETAERIQTIKARRRRSPRSRRRLLVRRDGVLCDACCGPVGAGAVATRMIGWLSVSETHRQAGRGLSSGKCDRGTPRSSN